MRSGADQPLYRRTSYGWSRRRIMFFVCGWRTNVGWYRPLFWMLILFGYKVYAYEVNAWIGASSEVLDYVTQVEAITADALQIIASGTSAQRYFSMGNSLGSEIALHIMKSAPQVRAAVLNTVRGNTADFLWNAPSAVLFKAGYVANGDYKSSVARKVKPISADSNLQALGDRPVLIYYSRPDKVIPRRNTLMLIKSLQKQKANYRLRRNLFLGHFGSSLKNFALAWRWLYFLHRAQK